MREKENPRPHPRPLEWTVTPTPHPSLRTVESAPALRHAGARLCPPVASGFSPPHLHGRPMVPRPAPLGTAELPAIVFPLAVAARR